MEHAPVAQGTDAKELHFAAIAQHAQTVAKVVSEFRTRTGKLADRLFGEEPASPIAKAPEPTEMTPPGVCGDITVALGNIERSIRACHAALDRF